MIKNKSLCWMMVAALVGALAVGCGDDDESSSESDASIPASDGSAAGSGGAGGLAGSGGATAGASGTGGLGGAGGMSTIDGGAKDEAAKDAAATDAAATDAKTLTDGAGADAALPRLMCPTSTPNNDSCTNDKGRVCQTPCFGRTRTVCTCGNNGRYGNCVFEACGVTRDAGTPDTGPAPTCAQSVDDGDRCDPRTFVDCNYCRDKITNACTCSDIDDRVDCTPTTTACQ